MLGKDSPSLLLYDHQGDIPGYTCNIYLVPDKRSALVILSNGKGLSNATDWIAQDLIQTMFGFSPILDFTSIASQAAAKYLSSFAREFQTPLEDNRVFGTQAPSSNDVIGTYVIDGLDLVQLGLAVDTEDPSKLIITINKQLDEVWKLRHYNWDVFCDLPDTFDEFVARDYSRDRWTSFLISFTRDATGKVSGLSQTMDDVVVHFTRS